MGDCDIADPNEVSSHGGRGTGEGGAFGGQATRS